MFLKIARKVVHSVRGRRIAAMRGQPQWCKVPAGFWMWIDPKEPLGRITLMSYLHSEWICSVAKRVCAPRGEAEQGHAQVQLPQGVSRILRIDKASSQQSSWKQLQQSPIVMFE